MESKDEPSPSSCRKLWKNATAKSCGKHNYIFQVPIKEIYSCGVGLNAICDHGACTNLIAITDTVVAQRGVAECLQV
jgi:hypothetical protein